MRNEIATRYTVVSLVALGTVSFLRKSISSFVMKANLTRFVAIAPSFCQTKRAPTHFFCSPCRFLVSNFGSICFLGKRNQGLTKRNQLIKLLYLSIRQMWTDSWIRRKKHSAAPPGIELGSSDCRSDALTTELRSHDRNCVRIFVFHQTVSSVSLRGDPSVS